MKIEEYVPERIPTPIAKAKSCRVTPPKIISERTPSRVEKLVARERVRTSLIERLTICVNAARGILGMFSRIRSKTMIVS